MADPEFLFLGDALWIDLVNTARGREPPVADRLPDLPAFVRWSAARRLEPDTPHHTYDDVVSLRAHLGALATALHERRPPAPGCIAAVNARLAGAAGHERLTRVGGCWELCFEPTTRMGALDAVARSAALTLAHPTMIVRRCAGPRCTLLFGVDSSGGTRHWCSAEACGGGRRVERRRGLLG